MNNIILALTLAYFGLTGPVSEVTQYGLHDYEKMVYRFDIQGRLIEYEEYGHPFAGDGGCVYRKMAHYEYGYTDKDSMIILYGFNEALNFDSDDTVLLLYPPRIATDSLYKNAEPEPDSKTSCYNLWKQSGNDYVAVRYDDHGNWIERVKAGDGDYTRADVKVRQIKYYRDIELMGLSVGVHTVTHRRTDNGQMWWNQYTFNREGYLKHFQSFLDTTALYEWHFGDTNDADVAASSLITIDTNSARTITYWGPQYEVESLESLPKGCNQESAFGLMFKYKGYLFSGTLYPLADKRWIVLSYWCTDEDDLFYVEDEFGNEIPSSQLYKNPFKGIQYPVITTDSVFFSTRNYGGEIIRFYKSPHGNQVNSSTLDFVCDLWVTAVDVKSRRVNCHTNPDDYMWGEPQNEEEREWKHPFKSCSGWVDERWICDNPLTTCP